MGIEEVVIAPRATWQNRCAERVIGSIRRECLDRLIVLNERHLRAIPSEVVAHYHGARAHLSLDRNSPIPR
jgi:putative transposase